MGTQNKVRLETFGRLQESLYLTWMLKMCQSVLGRREGKGLYSNMKSACKDMEEQRNTESLDITEIQCGCGISVQ